MRVPARPRVASEDGWIGSLSPSGTMSITESTAGSFTYDIVCNGAPPAASDKVFVKFTDPKVNGSGGGTLDPWCLLLLGLLMWRQQRPAQRHPEPGDKEFGPAATR